MTDFLVFGIIAYNVFLTILIFYVIKVFDKDCNTTSDFIKKVTELTERLGEVNMSVKKEYNYLLSKINNYEKDLQNLKMSISDLSVILKKIDEKKIDKSAEKKNVRNKK